MTFKNYNKVIQAAYIWNNLNKKIQNVHIYTILYAHRPIT